MVSIISIFILTMPVARLVANMTQTRNEGKINGNCLVLKPAGYEEKYPKLFATPFNANCLDVSFCLIVNDLHFFCYH